MLPSTSGRRVERMPFFRGVGGGVREVFVQHLPSQTSFLQRTSERFREEVRCFCSFSIKILFRLIADDGKKLYNSASEDHLSSIGSGFAVADSKF